MKLVGALVLLFVFVAANGKSFLDGGPDDSAANWRFITDNGPEDPIDGADDPDDYPVDPDEGDRPEDLAFDLDKLHQTLNKMENGHSESELRGKGSTCRPNIACTILNGYCVVNTTLCSGRLVANGCKGNNCQCCVPAGDNVNININLNETGNLCQVGENSTLWQKVDAAESDIKEVINEGNENITRDTEMSIQNLTMQIQSLKDSQDTAMDDLMESNSNLTLKLNNMMRHQGCPEGFFMPTGSSTQCFKLFLDSERSWTSARSKCQSEGLVLAKPYDAVALRSYIMERYGLNDEIWVDARGTGSSFKWQRDNKYLRTSNPLMYYTSSSYYTTSWCLGMATTDSQWNSYPTQPYMPVTCSTSEYPLCELIIPTGCPDGFFTPTGSKQCLKLFLDAEISWTAAKSKCQSEGLVLAKPYDAIAVRSYIMQKYGLNDEIWVDARGTGSSFKWQRDNKYLRTSNPLMYYTSSSYYTTSWCLGMATTDSQWNSYPTKPYMPVTCSTSEYPLCEFIMD